MSWVNIESASGAVGHAVGVSSKTALSVDKVVGFPVFVILALLVVFFVVLLFVVVEGID